MKKQGEIYGMSYAERDLIWGRMSKLLGYEPWMCREVEEIVDPEDSKKKIIVESDIKPHREGFQHRIHQRTRRHCVGIAPNRVGKDYAIGFEICCVLLSGGKKVMTVGATAGLAVHCFEWAVEMIMPFLNLMKIPYRKSDAHHKLRIFPDTEMESLFVVGTYKNLSGLEGGEWDLIVPSESGDQATNFVWIEEKMEVRLGSRLGSFIGLTTPDCRNPYLKQWLDKRAVEDDVEFIKPEEFSAYDCPHWNLGEIAKQKRLMLPRVFEEKFLGKFVKLTGLCISSFSDELHMVKEIPAPAQSMPGIMAIDWGFSDDPTVILVGKYWDGIWYIIKERVINRTSLGNMIPVIKEMCGEYSVARIVCDHDVAAYLALQEIGLPASPVKKTGVLDGVLSLDTMFHNNRIKIVRGVAPLLYEELHLYVYDEKKEEPIKDFNHAIDTCRYLTTYEPVTKPSARAWTQQSIRDNAFDKPVR